MARRKLKKKVINEILLILLMALGCYLMYEFYFKDKSFESNSNSDSKIIKYVKDNDIYKDKYKLEYEKIKMSDNKDFADIIITFLDKGYNGNEINYIMELSNKNITKLKDIDYINIKNYYKIKNFNVDNYERYENYKTDNEKYSYEQIVTYVNIKLDKEPYTDTVKVEDPNDLFVLVNKYNYLDEKYSPSDLTNIDGAYGNKVPMRKVIVEDFKKIQEAAKKELNINLMPTTAYRGAAFQKTLYDKYVKSDGKKAADTYSARPGYSEHQTGLAIDLKNTALDNIRLTDDQFKWLEDNSYKYGFIIRFPKDKEFITGYQFENWHIRYVGNDAAKIIHDKDLTLEEYVDLYIKEY